MVAVAGAGLSAVSRADAMVVWAPGAVVAPPANAASDPMVTVTAIACASVGNCTMVGSYVDGSGGGQGLLVIQSAGVWHTATEAILPTNAASDPRVKLTGVSCASAGNCTAIGSYIDSSGHTQGLGLTETSGTWARGVELIHPAFVNVSADPRISLNGISCAASGDCSAVGTYLNNNGHPEGMLLTQINGAWGTSPARDAEATLPADAAAEPAVSLASVSCGAIGECVAVGSYTNSSGHQQGLEIPESSTTWGVGIAALLPAGAAANPAVSLTSVSCASAGECAAVGTYNDASNHTLGLLLSESAGTWMTGLPATLPADAAGSPAVSLTSVSCPSAGSCDAVGSYNDTAGDLQGLMVTESSGSWTSGVAPTIPADAGATVFVQVLSVSCAGAGDCVAVGNYLDDSFVAHPVLLSQSGGAWSPGVEAVLPFGAAFPFADRETVACATGGHCAAAIGYTDTAGNSVAADVNGIPTSPATPTVTMSAPSAQVQLGAVIPHGEPLSGRRGWEQRDGTGVVHRVWTAGQPAHVVRRRRHDRRHGAGCRRWNLYLERRLHPGCSGHLLVVRELRRRSGRRPGELGVRRRDGRHGGHGTQAISERTPRRHHRDRDSWLGGAGGADRRVCSCGRNDHILRYSARRARRQARAGRAASSAPPRSNRKAPTPRPAPSPLSPRGTTGGTHTMEGTRPTRRPRRRAVHRWPRRPSPIRRRRRPPRPPHRPFHRSPRHLRPRLRRRGSRQR